MFNGLWDLQSSAKLTGQTFDAGIRVEKLFKYFMPSGIRIFARLISQSLVMKLESVFAMPVSQDEFEKKA